jgi:hypothetical protein
MQPLCSAAAAAAGQRSILANPAIFIDTSIHDIDLTLLRRGSVAIEGYACNAT